MANILYAIETLTSGGAEKFTLSLAKEMAKKYSNIYIYVLFGNRIEESMIENLGNNIKVVYPPFRFDFLLQKIDALLFHIKIDISIRDWFMKTDINETIIKYKISLIHSHLFKTDYIFHQVIKNDSRIPHFSTIHGDYLNFFDRSEHNIPIYKMLNFNKKLNELVKSNIKFICISDQQITFLKKYNKSSNCVKIYNGYNKNLSTSFKTKNNLGISEDSFVFGMVGRGIPEKGWENAIKAFLKLENNNSHLVLVGTSNFLTDLSNKYKSKKIHFVGYSQNPTEWLKKFDVGLHPSIYKSESLPTVVIEYMYSSIPTIASDIGETKKMLLTNNGLAGTVIPPNNEKKLTESMKKYITDKQLLLEHSENAKLGSKKFDMSICIKKHTEYYNIH